MITIVGGQIQEFHFPPIIDNDQWSKIAELSGLPPEDHEARSAIDDYIGYYRELLPDAHIEYGSLWKKLDGVRTKELASLRTLDAIISNPNFFPALAMGLDGQEKIPAGEVDAIRRWLEASCKEKQSFVDWYNKALTRLRHGERGRHRSSLFILVQLLNGLFKQYTGKTISRAKRRNGKQNAYDYVWEVCQIANPDLKLNPKKGRNSVDGVIRQVVTELRGNENSSEVGSWQHLIPHWEEANELSIDAPKLGIRVEYHKPHWSITTSAHTPRNAALIMLPIRPFIPGKERS